MFTGIIHDTGTITAISQNDVGTRRITVMPGDKKTLDKIELGASVSCSGICLTVIAFDKDTFTAELGDVTCQLTTAKNWRIGTGINLERALRAGDELGGHIVSGHVDGTCELATKAEAEGSWRFTFKIAPQLAPFIAARGSVVLDGISLTVVDVFPAAKSTERPSLSVMIIPHTLAHTTLGQLNINETVNIEIDMLARYVKNILEAIKS